ncbi:unnamed protein product [Gongylonema pulchrum]|uniref:Dimer_Tnp_hAT domain-containing protein n=1 Tax=Gongylonema pulchrum TaxID=637853 RepID=A0A183DU75_9BILA|nr:unnamed protein product [Gongylonema pulchrum]
MAADDRKFDEDLQRAIELSKQTYEEELRRGQVSAGNASEPDLIWWEDDEEATARYPFGKISQTRQKVRSHGHADTSQSA